MKYLAQERASGATAAISRTLRKSHCDRSTILGQASDVAYWHEAADPGCPLLGKPDTSRAPNLVENDRSRYYLGFLSSSPKLLSNF
jgi:hypothetical protein